MGVDPGLSRCGYACVEAGPKGVLRAVALGVLRTAPTDALPQRLAELRAELAALIADLQPHVVAVEQVFFQVNVRTAMSVAHASGVVMAEGAAARCEVVEYTPNQVKEAVTGDGAATKEQVHQMVQTLLGLTVRPKPADAADALALAVCHVWRGPAQDRLRVAALGRGIGAPVTSRTLPRWTGVAP
jgi:crossover junction endodeoxyribonuclease RuvC